MKYNAEKQNMASSCLQNCAETHLSGYLTKQFCWEPKDYQISPQVTKSRALGPHKALVMVH